MNDVERIIDRLDTLRLDELRQVEQALGALIEKIEDWQRPEYAEEQARKGKTYRQEYVKCGKASCKKCSGGKGHGPYWYAYWRDEGVLCKKYIGKTYHEA